METQIVLNELMREARNFADMIGADKYTLKFESSIGANVEISKTFPRCEDSKSINNDPLHGI